VLEVSVTVLTAAAEVAMAAVPDKEPLKVVAVTVEPRTETLVSTYTCVEAMPVDDLEPKRYNVLEVSVTVLTAAAELAIEAVPVKFPVIVFPTKETFVST
jgi:hypothetical protein